MSGGLQVVGNTASSFSSGISSFGTNTIEKMERTHVHKSINATAVFLFQQMSAKYVKENKNFVFFTPNLLTSLSMIYAGAPAELKAAMESTMKMGEVKEKKWHHHFSEWLEGIQKRGGSTTSKTNQVGGYTLQQTHIIAHKAPLTKEAKSNLMNYSPDFVEFSNPEEAKGAVNQKVAETTENIIPKLVESVDSDLMLLMASAALFKGQWEYAFDKKSTRDDKFYNADGTKVQIPMMYNYLNKLKTGSFFDGKENFRVRVLELPFKGNISLLLYKPSFDDNNGKDVEDCARQLKACMSVERVQAFLDKYENNLSSEHEAFRVGIPKMEFKDRTDILKALEGTLLAELITSSNLSGSLVNYGSPIYTPEFMSETNFKMDEEGVVIAAASYTASYTECAPPQPFIVKGPFGLVMVDKETKTIMSMGQVLKMDGKPISAKKEDVDPEDSMDVEVEESIDIEIVDA